MNLVTESILKRGEKEREYYVEQWQRRGVAEQRRHAQDAAGGRQELRRRVVEAATGAEPWQRAPPAPQPAVQHHHHGRHRPPHLGRHRVLCSLLQVEAGDYT